MQLYDIFIMSMNHHFQASSYQIVSNQSQFLWAYSFQPLFCPDVLDIYNWSWEQLSTEMPLRCLVAKTHMASSDPIDLSFFHARIQPWEYCVATSGLILQASYSSFLSSGWCLPVSLPGSRVQALSLERIPPLLFLQLSTPRRTCSRKQIFLSSRFWCKFLATFCPSPHSGDSIHKQNSRRPKPSLFTSPYPFP